MSRPVDELIQSIVDDFAAAKQTQEVLEAKALFRLLNYCPPPTLEIGETYPPSKGESEQDMTDIIPANESSKAAN
jgi:hypothetical protein